LEGDELTPRRLYEDVTGRDAHGDATFRPLAYAVKLVDALCPGWEPGVADTFAEAVERELRSWL
jgi:hypothetical protein